jgi:hypothetical protein
MKAVLYLIYKKIRNYLIDYRYNISKLAILLLFIVLIIFSFYSIKTDLAVRDVSELYALIFVFYLSTYIIGSSQGLKPGSGFFNKPDMHFLFSSPIKQRIVLSYGLARQTGASLYICVLLMLALPWIKKIYDISVPALIILLICYLIAVIVSNITAEVIYLYSNGDKDKQNFIKKIIYIFCALIFSLIVLPAIAKILTGKSLFEATVLALSAPIISLIPIAGWLQVLTASWFIENKAMFIVPLIPIIAYIVTAEAIIRKLDTDFYDNIICNDKIKNNPADSINILNADKNLKTGFRRGKKAGVFFYKHIIENRRKGIFLFDKYSVLYITLTFVFALFTKSKGLAPVFALSVLLMIFSSSSSGCVDEFKNYFIYLIPAGPVSKILYVCIEDFLKTAAETAIIFLLAGFVAKASAADMVICFLARLSFSMLYITVRILAERFNKVSVNRIIAVIVYFAAFIVISLPGLGIGILLKNAFTAISQTSCVLTAALIWNVASSALAVYFCRDLLSYAEL